MEINGKKVIVIGGASGMGRASAELLAERGAEVAIFDREGSDGKTVAEGVGGAFYPVDVTDFQGTEEALQTAVDKLGGLHVTVTTAGGGIAKRTLTKSGPHDLESFQSVIDLNLIATFNISRLAAAHMAKNEPEDEERGVIINTASIAAFEGQIGQIAYTAAKAGVAGMCLTMARDLGSVGIRVLAIAPPSAPSARSGTRGPPRRVRDGRRSVRYPWGTPPRPAPRGADACPAPRGSGAAA